MDGARFDGFARTLARTANRRDAIRLVAGGVMATLATSFMPRSRPVAALGACRINTITLWLAVFIDADQSQKPGLGASVTLGPMAGVALIEGPEPATCFATDNRSFDTSISASARVHVMIEIDVPAGIVGAQPPPYSSATTEVCCSPSNPRCPYGNLICVDNAQPRGGFSALVVSSDRQTLTTTLNVGASDPCLPSPEVEAVGTLTIQLRAGGAEALVTFQGMIEPWPSYEMYAAADLGVPVPVFPPQRPLPNSGPWNLFGSPNRPVSGSVVLRACDGRCDQMATDPTNCGACGHNCAPGQSCVEGVCGCGAVGSCAGSCCANVCVDAETDARNCGTCGHVCTAQERCVSGRCACGFQECGPGTTCCGGGCVTLETDAKHCGSCGRACAGNDRCTGGHCVCGFLVCAVGSGCCDGACTDLASPANCGTCGRRCAEGERCADGVCSCGLQQCVPGTICCGGGCMRPCPAPRVLNRATCHCDCPPDRPKDCNGTCAICCADADCRGGKTCRNGACVCPAGLKDCSGRCAACCGDGDCQGGKHCRNGTCSCVGGARDCGGTCADIDTDRTNCGGCGHRCGADQGCAHGVCTCDPHLCTGECCNNICFATCPSGHARDPEHACQCSNSSGCTPIDCAFFCSFLRFDPQTCQCVGCPGGTFRCGSEASSSLGCCANGDSCVYIADPDPNNSGYVCHDQGGQPYSVCR